MAETRFPELKREEMTPEQRKAAEAIVAGPRGGLRGPFNAWLRSPDFAALKQRLADAVVFDGRNLYEPAEVEAAGLAYYGIGRGRSLRAG